jgi:hypothetical protein
MTWKKNRPEGVPVSMASVRLLNWTPCLCSTPTRSTSWGRTCPAPLLGIPTRWRDPTSPKRPDEPGRPNGPRSAPYRRWPRRQGRFPPGSPSHAARTDGAGATRAQPRAQVEPQQPGQRHREVGVAMGVDRQLRGLDGLLPHNTFDGCAGLPLVEHDRLAIRTITFCTEIKETPTPATAATSNPRQMLAKHREEGITEDLQNCVRCHRSASGEGKSNGNAARAVGRETERPHHREACDGRLHRVPHHPRR